VEQTLKIINQMVDDGVIKKYAIGGAMAANFYVEPDTTFDLDIFCVLADEAGSGLDLLRPLYDYLREMGYQPDRETIDIEGMPVQFLPVFNALNDEAVEQANITRYVDTPVSVMTPEHLVAIMLQTGRAKDYGRINRFLEAGAVDLGILKDIFSRHDLMAKWTEFQRRFNR
jgi:hypothetical protein